jgi:hypothetical protein
MGSGNSRRTVRVTVPVRVLVGTTTVRTRTVQVQDRKCDGAIFFVSTTDLTRRTDGLK